MSIADYRVRLQTQRGKLAAEIQTSSFYYSSAYMVTAFQTVAPIQLKAVSGSGSAMLKNPTYPIKKHNRNLNTETHEG